MRSARIAKSAYRRRLPHLQIEGRPIFVAFATLDRWALPEAARALVARHCLREHGHRVHLHGFVVMPDHVHLAFTPLVDDVGRPYSLAEIMQAIKGASAHAINKCLGRKGSVWQPESFDHLLRSDESLQEKVEYICANPVRRGLTASTDDYPWLWREWIEGAEDSL
jgi:REP element-mobilizing transposase RayT